MIRARWTGLAVATALLATLFGCQGEETPPGVGDGFDKSGRAAGAENRARPAVRLTQAAAATLKEPPNHAMAALSSRQSGESVRQTINARRGQQKHTSVVLVRRHGARSEVRTIEQTSWLRSQEASVQAALPPGKEWVQMPTRRLAVAGMPSVDGLLSVLYVFKGATSVREVGKAPARYAFALKLDKAICAAPARLRPKIRSLLAANEGASVSMKGQAWLTAAHRVQRVRINANSGGEQVATFDLRIAGGAANARVIQPAPDQVVALGQIAGESQTPAGGGDTSC